MNQTKYVESNRTKGEKVEKMEQDGVNWKVWKLGRFIHESQGSKDLDQRRAFELRGCKSVRLL